MFENGNYIPSGKRWSGPTTPMNAPRQTTSTTSSGGTGLAALLNGIGRSINQAGQTVVGGLGAIGGSIGDFVDDLGGNKNKNSYRDDFMKWNMGTDDAGDAWTKYGGAALSTLNNALDFIPVTAAITKNPLVNSLQGGIGGFADELYEDGKNFKLEDALSRAGSGAVAGAVTGGLSNKLGNASSAVGKALLNNRAVTSNIGRNALTGAVGGGIGAGAQTLFSGGSAGDALVNALSGAGAGALASGVMGGTLGLGSKALSKMRAYSRGTIQDNSTSTLGSARGEDAKVPEQAVSDGVEARRQLNISQENQGLLDGWNEDIARLEKSPYSLDKEILERITKQRDDLLKSISGAEKSAGHSGDLSFWKNADWENDGVSDAWIRSSNDLDTNINAVLGDIQDRYPDIEVIAGKSGLSEANYVTIQDQNGNSYEFRIAAHTDPGSRSNADEYIDLRNLDDFSQVADKLERKASEIANATTNTRPESALNEPLDGKNIDASPTQIRTTPLDYQGNNVNISNPNLIQRFGQRLSQAGDVIKNSDVTNALYSKTATKVTANNSINRLRDMGFTPETYKEAAKVSTVTNRFIDDALERSGASLIDQDLMTRARTLPDSAVISSPAYQKRFDDQMSQLETRIQTGKVPNEFSVAQLNKESRKFGQLANQQYRNSTNVAGDITNPDAYALAQAYTNVKNNLRTAAEAGVNGLTDDYTRNNLAQTLKNAGANQKTIDYILSGGDLKGVIRNTGLFEDARTMDRDIQANQTRRNANSGSQNPITQVLNSSGIPQITSAIASPIGSVTGNIASRVGAGLQRLGSSTNNQTTPSVSDPPSSLMGALNKVSTRGISADQGNQVMNYLQDQNQPVDENTGLAGALNSSMSGNQASNLGAETGYDAMAAPEPTVNVGGRQVTLSDTEQAMVKALMAGDVNAYEQLGNIYNILLGQYERNQDQQVSPLQDLSPTQKNTIVGLQNAYDSLASLAQSFSDAGGGQGRLGGNLAEFGATLGMNDPVSVYNSQATALINTLKNAIGKTDAANTDPEVQRLMAMIPKITDTENEASSKLWSLSQYIQNTYDNTINTYSGNYELY